MQKPHRRRTARGEGARGPTSAERDRRGAQERRRRRARDGKRDHRGAMSTSAWTLIAGVAPKATTANERRAHNGAKCPFSGQGRDRERATHAVGGRKRLADTRTELMQSREGCWHGRRRADAAVQPRWLLAPGRCNGRGLRGAGARLMQSSGRKLRHVPSRCEAAVRLQACP